MLQTILERPHTVHTAGGGGSNRIPPEVISAEGGSDDQYIAIGLAAIEGYLADPEYAAKVEAHNLSNHEILDLGYLASRDTLIDNAA